jgi:hypothetical protein
LKLRSTIAALLILLATSCARKSPESVEQPEPQASILTAADTFDFLRESARETLDANCAECHTKGLPTALPRALRIFDLTEPDWSRHMSEAQLREAARRLSEPFAPTRGEGDVRPIQVSDEARARFTRFVDAAVAQRRGGDGQ